MSFSIEKYYPDFNTEWDKFVQSSDNGTIFQERKFLAYHKKKSFKDNSLVVKNKDNIVGLIPFNEINKENNIQLYSHQGASFGGLIYKNNNLQKVLTYTDLICEYFQKKNSI